MNNKLKESKNKKEFIKIKTTHPEKDIYDGVIVGLSRSVIVLQQDSDLRFDGIKVFRRNRVSKVRKGSYEKSLDKVLRYTGEIKNLNKKKWINDISSIKECIEILYKKKIWPAIELVFENEATLYIGPITKLRSKYFCIRAYDAEGEWEKEYDIDYSEIFSIQFFDNYSVSFNSYMRSKLDAA